MTRTAVVTGAAKGIGAATSELLADRGWSVVGIARDWRGAEPEGSITLDLREHDRLRDAIASLERVDALVNNAAVMPEVPLVELDAATISATLDVNLTAAMVAASAAVPALRAQGGAIVNVASVHALATRGGLGAYPAAKGGLVAFTRAAAVELGPLGIRVNAVVPGAVDTAMLMPGTEGEARREGIAALGARTPLGRVAEPREIAEAIAFLADGERSSFITGQTLVADGGALARLSTE
jgi:NAD(P)-dependent dehydrogenase (short-subunit alcohol dehydrogenase family)